MRNLFTAFFYLSFLAVPAMAEEADPRANPDFYRLSPFEIKEVVPTAQELYSDYLLPTQVQPIPNFQALDWGTLVMIGEKLIPLIKAGMPVINVKRDAVAVIPQGVTAWDQLGGWQIPVTKVYTMTAKNFIGLSAVELRLKVSAMYGGSLEGRGKFLANVVVVPTSIYLLWGFNLDVFTEHREPVNMGSRDNPVAGLGFDIRYRYGSAITEVVGAQDYFVSGTGEITELQ